MRFNSYQTSEMAAEYGCSKRGQRTLLYRNFEYLKERDNVCGTTSWRCCKYKNLKCNAQVVTSGLRTVSEKQSEHNHAGNSAAARARKTVSEMKQKVQDITATPSSSQAAVAATVADDVLMALPKRPP